jgi:hypothetical protein
MDGVSASGFVLGGEPSNSATRNDCVTGLAASAHANAEPTIPPIVLNRLKYFVAVILKLHTTNNEYIIGIMTQSWCIAVVAATR